MNQRWNPLKGETPARTWWIWARLAAKREPVDPGKRTGADTVSADPGPRGRAAAYSWKGCRGRAGHHPRRLVSGERGNLSGLPSPPASQVGGGQGSSSAVGPEVGRRVLVVVRGRESRPHGEGDQRVRSRGTWNVRRSPVNTGEPSPDPEGPGNGYWGSSRSCTSGPPTPLIVGSATSTASSSTPPSSRGMASGPGQQGAAARQAWTADRLLRRDRA